MRRRVVVVLSGLALPRSVFLSADYEIWQTTWAQYEWYFDLEIWEAASATLAATSFVPLIDKELNGRIKRSWLPSTLGVRNPVNELWHEAAAEWGPGNLEPQICCLLFIGIGMLGPSKSYSHMAEIG
jgi:hypothetical protein